VTLIRTGVRREWEREGGRDRKRKGNEGKEGKRKKRKVFPIFQNVIAPLMPTGVYRKS